MEENIYIERETYIDKLLYYKIKDIYKWWNYFDKNLRNSYCT